MSEAGNIKASNLGNGCYLFYREVSNGFGGSHPVNITFVNDEKNICREITDSYGFFADYPGHEHGEWEKDLSMTFFHATRFTAYVSKFNNNGVCYFSWEVQPDGRYWEDEDGYGMTRDKEICLYALINDEGLFITPFFDKNDERYKAIK